MILSNCVWWRDTNQFTKAHFSCNSFFTFDRMIQIETSMNNFSINLFGSEIFGKKLCCCVSMNGKSIHLLTHQGCLWCEQLSSYLWGHHKMICACVSRSVGGSSSKLRKLTRFNASWPLLGSLLSEGACRGRLRKRLRRCWRWRQRLPSRNRRGQQPEQRKIPTLHRRRWLFAYLRTASEKLRGITYKYRNSDCITTLSNTSANKTHHV